MRGFLEIDVIYRDTVKSLKYEEKTLRKVKNFYNEVVEDEKTD